MVSFCVSVFFGVSIMLVLVSVLCLEIKGEAAWCYALVLVLAFPLSSLPCIWLIRQIEFAVSFKFGFMHLQYCVEILCSFYCVNILCNLFLPPLKVFRRENRLFVVLYYEMDWAIDCNSNEAYFNTGLALKYYTRHYPACCCRCS